jgi:hypothetical protein
MANIELKPLFQMKAESRVAPQLIGQVPQGYTRRVMCVTGGNFKGERLSGKILPGGGDWVIERPSGGLHLDVRLTLETDQGEYIYMTYNGRRNGPPEIMEKIRRREYIPPGVDYFRIAAQFEVSAPRLMWLNDIIAIGTGYREDDGPVYDVFEVA